MNVELRHLRYFVAVAEEASFTSAARRVHVAQQVLSTQIRQLEESIGARLLERTSRGVTLTPAGSAFLDAARDTLSTLERGVTSARNSAQAVPGQLSVGLSLAASGETRTALLSAFQRAHPHVEVRLRTFDLSKGVPSTTMCVAWRTGDPRPEVRSFIEVAIAAARGGQAPWGSPADGTRPAARGA
jgi:DNA-binding transcriptional LysR family regulator